MKKLIRLSLVAGLLIAGAQEMQAQWGKKVVGNGNVTTRTVTTGDYDGVKGVGSMDIHLEKGSEGTITVKTDENIQEFIIVEVKNGALVIRTKKNVSIRTKKGVHVYVPFQDISEVSLVGSGDIDTKDAISANNFEVNVTGSGDVVLEVNSKILEASVTGSGDMELTGSTEDLEVRVSGSGDFKGFDLNAQNTDASVSGSGDAKIVAKSSLRARVNGSGDIVYKGNPEKSDTKTSGSGDISSY
ncbi:MAG: head GIN domain-containing protein [Aureisphaera sp.]